MLPQGIYGVRKNVPDNRKVIFEGMVYYPQGYLLEFSESGKVIHTAILHALEANSVMRCPLDRVEKHSERKEVTQ